MHLVTDIKYLNFLTKDQHFNEEPLFLVIIFVCNNLKDNFDFKPQVMTMIFYYKCQVTLNCVHILNVY